MCLSWFNSNLIRAVPVSLGSLQRQYLYLCTSKASKLSTCQCRRGTRSRVRRQGRRGLGRATAAAGACSVSICTCVPVKQVNGVAGSRDSCSRRLQRHYLYLCTSKASKLSSWFARQLQQAPAASVFVLVYQYSK
jgi:hypothetical protein